MDLENGQRPVESELNAAAVGQNGNGAHPPGQSDAASALPDAEATTPEAAVIAAVEDPAEPAAGEVPEVAPVVIPEDEEPERNVIAEWVITILLLLFGTSMIVQAYVIPTPSMVGTLLVGDHLLVDKLAYAPEGSISRHLLPYRPIQRGDIIVFRYPLDLSQTYVKRVVGLPGDRVKLINRVLHVNGKEYKEPYAIHKSEQINYYKHFFPREPEHYLRKEAREMIDQHVDANSGELVVPKDCYFALGDNRDESDDSRYWGFVPRQNIIGKPLIVYWSFDAAPGALQDPSLSVSHLKDVLLNFFSKTRWNRTFQLIRSHRLQ